LGGFQRRIVTSLVGIIILGVGVSFLGLIPVGAFLLAIFVIFVVGITLPMANGPLQAATQVSVVPEMQGRVFSLLARMAVAGPVADLIGIRLWLLGAGIVTALAGIIAFFIPAVMHIEDRADEVESLSSENELVADFGV
jgi:DHA3 family macrolide efflux protein-like MFS transporter